MKWNYCFNMTKFGKPIMVVVITTSKNSFLLRRFLLSGEKERLSLFIKCENQNIKIHSPV